MNRIILALLINVLATGAYAASATDSAFQNLSDEYISDLTNFSPVTATMIGDHSADGDIDQVDAAARAESLTLLREYQDALAARTPTLPQILRSKTSPTSTSATSPISRR